MTKLYIFLTFTLIFNHSLWAQLSPGDLAKAHAHLEGMSNCTKCHTLGSKISNDKCLSCHTEIKSRVEKKQGYHASKQVYKKSCFICHSDHHGRNYQIIRFDIQSFDHETTGYTLQGKHAKIECRECHKQSFIVDPDVKKKKSTYLGLGTNCLSCHEDYHEGSLGAQCSDCHSFEGFKPAEKFDHAKTNFPLRGRHTEVPCSECHPVIQNKGTNFQKFSGVEFSSCASCHTDVHNGQFGTKCSDCHTEQSFKNIKNSENFDHSRTGYELIGKHNQVDCRKCHTVSLTAPLKHDYCRDCHVDYHEAQFTIKNPQSDCRDCHTPFGFEESSFNVERHNLTAFVLEGAHDTVKCEACHKKEQKWSFRNIGAVCVDCHTDIHDQRLSDKYYPDKNCRSCHVPTTWSTVTFDHSVTNFPLEGRHAEQSCRQCHLQIIGDAEMGSARDIVFKGLKSECMSCHPDEHEGQFMDNGLTECNRCHTSDNWIASLFDHNNARFKLDGQHEKVACLSCHPVAVGRLKPYILYKTGKTRCADCH